MHTHEQSLIHLYKPYDWLNVIFWKKINDILTALSQGFIKTEAIIVIKVLL
jgi:hypothetical protein